MRGRVDWKSTSCARFILNPPTSVGGVSSPSGTSTIFSSPKGEGFPPSPKGTLNGRHLRRFQFSPRNNYQPDSRGAKTLNRLEGTVWIDPKQSQIARLHIVFREDMKFFFGLFGRVSKGSEATAEQWQDENGLWLLDNITVSLDARFYFLKKYRRRIVYSYTDYEKYSVETDEDDFRQLGSGDGSR